LIAAAVVLCMTAIACGDSEEQPTAAPDDFADKRAYEGVTITVAAEDVAPTTTLKQIIGDFEEETGITVKMETFDEVTLREKEVLDFTSGAATYDVVNLQWWFVPEFANAGYLVSVDDLIAKGTVPEWFNEDDFTGSILDGFRFDGTLYGVPFWLIGGMHYYRTDLLDQIGEKPPATVDDVLRIAQRAEPTGAYGWVGRGNREFSSFGSFAGFAAGYGAKLFDDEYRSTLLSDPAWKESVTDWLTLETQHSPPGAANLNWYDAYQTFQKGDVIQMFETSDYGPAFESPKDSSVVGKVGYMPAPEGPAGQPMQWFFSEGYGINADASEEQQGAAWLFLQWRAAAETQMKELSVPDSPRFDVVSSEVLDSPEYADAAKAAKQVDYAEGLKETFKIADPWYWPAVPEFTQIAEVFAKNMSSAISGEMTVDEVLEDSHAQIEQIMERSGYYE
jgi:ABC-type glycerol-3-phosphate transport system substrate-binding protein